MVDTVDRVERSRIMGLVRSHGNKSTEAVVAALFRKAGLRGWRRQVDLPGRPDFAFPKSRLAVFVDGCF
jgi:DNA mismatch endonuclease (patch repair protein)